jgi:hypothetical protein
MVKMSIENRLFRPAFLFLLLVVPFRPAGLYSFSIYDMVLVSTATDNKNIIGLFFDQDFEDQVLIVKALGRRNELFFQDIAFEIRQRYSQRMAFKYEHLVRILADSLLENPDPGPALERIKANPEFFDTLFMRLGDLADPGCKSRIIALMDYELKPEYSPVLAGEADRILVKVREDELSAEHFLPEILALMDFADKHGDREFLYFGSEIIKRVKNRDAYHRIRKIMDKLL